MRDNFPNDLKHVLVLEGGYVNNPADPGGATNKGVTQHVYNAWRASKGLSTQSVLYITSAEVAEIYRMQYADKVQYDKLPSGVDGVVFDGAVNSGPGQSIKWLQKALGNVRVDGVMGIATLQAVEAVQNHDALIQRIVDIRMAFLRALKTWRVFGKGWTSRVEQVKKNGQAVARGSVGPNPVYFEGGNAKAVIEDAKSPPSKAFGDATTGGGAIVVGLNQITDSLGQLTWIPHVDKVLSVATAVGGVMMAAGLGWRWYQKRKEAALKDALNILPVMPETLGETAKTDVETQADAPVTPPVTPVVATPVPVVAVGDKS